MKLTEVITTDRTGPEIGGRTRLYAALALGAPIKIKVIDANTFHKKSV